MNIIGMSLFALAMSISPGPVNVTTLSSGINYGFNKTFLFVAGATIGFSTLLFSIGLGASALLSFIPNLYVILRYLGSGYIIYIGLKILRSNGQITTQRKKLPKFHHGFLMQWLNPKAWIACVSGVSIFVQKDSTNSLLVFISLYFIICYISISLWAFFGAKINSMVNNEAVILTINMVLGIILIGLGIYALVTPIMHT